MEQIGVGECQTHQVLWWDARIRNCVKEVERNGGRLDTHQIHPEILKHVGEGKAAGLYLDSAADQVLLRTSGSTVQPPPLHLNHHRHAQQQQQLQQQHLQQQQQQHGQKHHRVTPPPQPAQQAFGNSLFLGQNPQLAHNVRASGAAGGYPPVSPNPISSYVGHVSPPAVPLPPRGRVAGQAAAAYPVDDILDVGTARRVGAAMIARAALPSPGSSPHQATLNAYRYSAAAVPAPQKSPRGGHTQPQGFGPNAATDSTQPSQWNTYKQQHGLQPGRGDQYPLPQTRPEAARFGQRPAGPAVTPSEARTGTNRRAWTQVEGDRKNEDKGEKYRVTTRGQLDVPPQAAEMGDNSAAAPSPVRHADAALRYRQERPANQEEDPLNQRTHYVSPPPSGTKVEPGTAAAAAAAPSPIRGPAGEFGQREAVGTPHAAALRELGDRTIEPPSLPQQRQQQQRRQPEPVRVKWGVRGVGGGGLDISKAGGGIANDAAMLVDVQTYSSLFPQRGLGVWRGHGSAVAQVLIVGDHGFEPSGPLVLHAETAVSIETATVKRGSGMVPDRALSISLEIPTVHSLKGIFEVKKTNASGSPLMAVFRKPGDYWLVDHLSKARLRVTVTKRSEGVLQAEDAAASAATTAAAAAAAEPRPPPPSENSAGQDCDGAARVSKRQQAAASAPSSPGVGIVPAATRKPSPGSDKVAVPGMTQQNTESAPPEEPATGRSEAQGAGTNTAVASKGSATTPPREKTVGGGRTLLSILRRASETRPQGEESASTDQSPAEGSLPLTVAVGEPVAGGALPPPGNGAARARAGGADGGIAFVGGGVDGCDGSSAGGGGGGAGFSLDISAVSFTPREPGDDTSKDAPPTVVGDARKPAMSPRSELYHAAVAAIDASTPAPKPQTSTLFRAVSAATAGDAAVASAAGKLSSAAASTPPTPSIVAKPPAATSALYEAALAAATAGLPPDIGTSRPQLRAEARSTGLDQWSRPRGQFPSIASGRAPAAVQLGEQQTSATTPHAETPSATPPAVAAPSAAPAPGVTRFVSSSSTPTEIHQPATAATAAPSPSPSPCPPSSSAFRQGGATFCRTNPEPSVPTSPQERGAQTTRQGVAPTHGSARGVTTAPTPAAAAAPAIADATTPETPTPFVVVRDERSMSDAVGMLTVRGDNHNKTEAGDGGRQGGGGGGGIGRLSKALEGTGPVAVRLNGTNLGASDGVISTIQVATGAAPSVLVFDVQSLLNTPQGKQVLCTELHTLLEDADIGKEMHDAHDNIVALARLLQGLGLRPRINSVMDLQLAHEALWGDALNSFGDALRAFRVCRNPRRMFSMHGEREGAPSEEVLHLAADGAARLSEACRLARVALIAAGQQERHRDQRLDNVFKASQMKVDSATNTMRDGWRRMTFVDGGDGRAVEGGAKTLASYELQEAKERAERRRVCNDHLEAEVLSSASSRNAPDKKNASTTARQGLSEPDLSQQGRGYERNGSRMQETKITFGTLDGSLSNGGSGNSQGGGPGLGLGGGESGGGSRPHLLIDATGRLGNGYVDDVEQRLQDLPSPASCQRRAAGTSQGASNGGGSGSGGGDTDGGDTDGRRRQVQQQSWGAGGEDDVLELLKHMPKVFVNDIMAHSDVVSGLEEVVLDQGCRPRGLVNGRGKVYLCKDRGVLVTRYHLNCVVGKLEHLGLFGRDNMAGFDGLLHRVGVMRDKGGKIYGVTIRVGRYAKGMADMVDDLLFDHHIATGSGKRASPAPASILVLGRHGAGKTTLVRDMCRKLSSHETVVIVDTRSDIGGAGVVPHRGAIGEESRRVMVPQGTQQHEVILQAYRNHNPQTIVVDEISSQLDVEACMAVKARGVRIVAGAVGDLPYVLDSPEIGAALGGLEDTQGSGSGDDDRDDQTERRAGSPVFEAVVELEGRAAGVAPQGAVVTNVEAVVDELLDKGCVTRPEMRAPVGRDDVMLDEDGGEDAAGGIGGHGRCTPFLRKVSRDQADKWVW